MPLYMQAWRIVYAWGFVVEGSQIRRTGPRTEKYGFEFRDSR